MATGSTTGPGAGPALVSGGPPPVDTRTVPERLRDAVGRAGDRGVTFVAGGRVERASWARLHDEACALATVLAERDVGPGRHVALLGTASRELVTSVLASWMAGAAVVVPPLPLRLGSLEEFVAQTRSRLVDADAAMLFMDPSLAAMVDPGAVPMVTLDEAMTLAGIDPQAPVGAGSTVAKRAERFDVPRTDPTDLAVLQFTSGSTADPKGVMLAHRQLAAQIDAATTGADFDPQHDVMVSWLPLYHDMGLIGFLAVPACEGTDLVIGSPQEFTAAPLRWMEWLSAFDGTVTAGPTFAYVLATRALRGASGLDLSRVRIALYGAEPIDPPSAEAFCEAARPFGFPPEAVFCAFGMAEATLAVTFPPAGRGLHVDVVDPRALEHDRAARPPASSSAGRRLAKLGRPLPGLELRVVEPDDGSPLAERQVGEVEVRGACVTPGYYRNPVATAAAFRDDWLRTGDLGYLVDGELVLCARRKDVIIVSGRNVYPEEAERAAASVSGVRAGNVVTFGVSGRRSRERIVVVAEVKAEDAGDIRSEVAQRVREALGLPPADVVLVAPGTLPKTSSGKLQRWLCRERYLEGSLAPAE